MQSGLMELSILILGGILVSKVLVEITCLDLNMFMYLVVGNFEFG